MRFERFEKPPFSQEGDELEKGEGLEELEKMIREYGYFSLFEIVKNKVIFVNKQANVPPEFKEKLELRKESPLGLFVKEAGVPNAEKLEELKELGGMKFETWPREHGRSAILERRISTTKVIFFAM